MSKSSRPWWKKLAVILGAFALGWVLVLGVSALAPEPACAQFMGCGMRPMKPMPPMGCQDLCAQCQCDSRGMNCRWFWVCC